MGINVNMFPRIYVDVIQRRHSYAWIFRPFLISESQFKSTYYAKNQRVFVYKARLKAAFANSTSCRIREDAVEEVKVYGRFF